MKIPDFYIIGAPKCGTTALSEYLRGHPNICFSHAKEPHFFSDDLPNYKIDRTLDSYMRLNFSHFRPPRHELMGESSVYYYLSAVAVPNILKVNAAAKFVYMVRNPVDMVYSFHSQLYFSNDEDVPAFETAWEWQEARAGGARIPKSCREPRLLQYREVGKLGGRLQLLRSLLSTNQLRVIVFDDFVANPKAVYEQVLTFLRVATDGRQDFPVVNENKMARSKFLSRVSSSIPRPLHNAVRELKHAIGAEGVPFNVLAKVNVRRGKRPRLSDDFRRRLLAEFDPDIRLLERCLNRDLSQWRTSEDHVASAAAARLT
jgi:hypothetical protein